MKYLVKMEDLTLSETQVYAVDSMDEAIRLTCEKRNLAWTPTDREARIYEIIGSGIAVSIFAIYGGNRQVYTISLRSIT